VLVITGPNGNLGADLTRALVERGDMDAFRVAAHRPEVIAEM